MGFSHSSIKTIKACCIAANTVEMYFTKELTITCLNVKNEYSFAPMVS